MVLDEAKILATPIVATEYLTVRDQIQEGKEGILTPITPQGIADGIRKLARNQEMQETIRSYLSSQSYGNSEEIQKYIQIFENN